MRICFFVSRIDQEVLEAKKLLSELSFSGVKVTGPVYLISYRWLRRRYPEFEYRALGARESLKMKICSQLFRLIDETRWVPASLAALVLYFCQKELIEVIRGCDPDVVLSLGLRWHRQLKKLLRKRKLNWTFCADTRCVKDLAINRKRRTLDPSAMVSIILPTYNGVRYLRQSIESCLNQTYPNIELIVVDDGSASDDIYQLIRAYQDLRLQYFRHPQNLGIAKALNTGFKHSEGRYLTWTSDDNYYDERAIEAMVGYLQDYSDIDFVYTDLYKIDGEGSIQEIMKVHPTDYLSHDNGIGACFLYKRKVYEEVGEFSSDLLLAEDYDYWVRVSKKFTMQRLFKPLYYYRLHEHSLTSQFSREAVLEKVKVVKEVNKLRSR